MREIKFRGKRTDTGEWVYGDLIENQGRFFIYHATSETTLKDEDNSIIVLAEEVNLDTVGQYTGLHDKNGKETYEDDILRVYDGKRYFNIVVKWSEEAMAFMACYCDGNQSPLSWFSNLLSRTYEIEVIGNIHDNPELLEDE